MKRKTEDKPNYLVNPGKKITTAVKRQPVFANKFRRAFNEMISLITKTIYDWDLIEQPEYIGMAVCSDADQFSQAIGMDIANKRATIKQLDLRAEKLRKLKRQIAEMDKFIDSQVAKTKSTRAKIKSDLDAYKQGTVDIDTRTAMFNAADQKVTVIAPQKSEQPEVVNM